jgi:hypothetical protein
MYTQTMVVTYTLGQPIGPIFKGDTWPLMMGQIGWTATMELPFYAA